MTLWSQGCSELVKLLHGCDEVVARLSQGCHKLVTRLQGLYNLATTLSFLYGVHLITHVYELYYNCHDDLCMNDV